MTMHYLGKLIATRARELLRLINQSSIKEEGWDPSPTDGFRFDRFWMLNYFFQGVTDRNVS